MTNSINFDRNDVADSNYFLKQNEQIAANRIISSEII
jgi:hypothetical protein